MTALFFATLAMVFLLAYQQQNVTHGHYMQAFITPLGIAAAQYYSFGINAEAYQSGNHEAILVAWIGGGIGVVCAMYVKRRMMRSNING